jgi:hypothetical protein
MADLMWPGAEATSTASQTNQSDNNTPEKAAVTAHLKSDVDSSPVSQHHTLGVSTNQASPGDHIHDGRSSRKLPMPTVDINHVDGLESFILQLIEENQPPPISDNDILAAIERHPASVAGYIRKSLLAVTFSGSRNTDTWRQNVMTALVALGCTNNTTA